MNGQFALNSLFIIDDEKNPEIKNNKYTIFGKKKKINNSKKIDTRVINIITKKKKTIRKKHNSINNINKLIKKKKKIKINNDNETLIIGSEIMIEGTSPRIMKEWDNTSFKCVRFGNKFVVGHFFLMSKYITYKIKAIVQERQNKISYFVKNIEYKPHDLTLYILDELVIESLNIYDNDRLSFIKEVENFLIEKDEKYEKTNIINTNTLIKYFNNNIFRDLLISSSYFKCHEISQLNQLYKDEELSRLNFDDMKELIVDLGEAVEKFCFKPLYHYNLPELNIKKYIIACSIFNQKTSKEIIDTINYYTIFKKKLQQSKSVCLDKKMILDKILKSPRLQLLLKHKLIQLECIKFNNHINNKLHTLGFLSNDLIKLKHIKDILDKMINSRPIKGKLPKSKQSNFNNLSNEQKYVYELAVNEVNFIMILGDAGTGKTTLGKLIFDSYKKKNILPLGWQGRLGYLLNTLYGRGSHIDKCVEQIKNKTKNGKKIEETTEIVILDEFSVIDFEKLWKILYYFKNLKKLIIMGDGKQMPPIGYGPLMKVFRIHFKNTPYLFELKYNFRIDKDSKKLKNFLDNIIKGDMSDISFTNRDIIYDNGSISIIKSSTIKEDVQFIMEYKNYLKENLEDSFKFQILTQKNIIKTEINRECLKFETNDRINNIDVNEINDMCFFSGNQVVFITNSKDHIMMNNKNIKSDLVYTGEIAEINEIYLINENFPLEEQYSSREILKSTAYINNNNKDYAMMSFVDGKKINIGYYGIDNVVKGNTITTSSSQGDQYDIVISYIHKKVSKTFTKEEFYTMISRTKKKCIIFVDKLSDIIFICNNKCIHPPNYILYFLPLLDNIRVSHLNINNVENLKIKYNININNNDKQQRENNVNEDISDISDDLSNSSFNLDSSQSITYDDSNTNNNYYESEYMYDDIIDYDSNSASSTLNDSLNSSSGSFNPNDNKVEKSNNNNNNKNKLNSSSNNNNNNMNICEPNKSNIFDKFSNENDNDNEHHNFTQFFNKRNKNNIVF